MNCIFIEVALIITGENILYPEKKYLPTSIYSVPEGKVNILGGYNIGRSKQKSVYVLMKKELNKLRSYFMRI
jgi:hypothetical protein